MTYEILIRLLSENDRCDYIDNGVKLRLELTISGLFKCRLNDTTVTDFDINNFIDFVIIIY